jgi:hypothetical protein
MYKKIQCTGTVYTSDLGRWKSHDLNNIYKSYNTVHNDIDMCNTVRGR